MPTRVEAGVDVRRRVALLLVGRQAADRVAEERVAGRGSSGRRDSSTQRRAAAIDRRVEERVVDAVHRDVRPRDPSPAPPLLGVAGELVAVHGEVRPHAARHAVERLGLRLLERHVVAVEVGAGGVAARARPRRRPGSSSAGSRGRRRAGGARGRARCRAPGRAGRPCPRPRRRAAGRRRGCGRTASRRASRGPGRRTGPPAVVASTDAVIGPRPLTPARNASISAYETVRVRVRRSSGSCAEAARGSAPARRTSRARANRALTRPNVAPQAATRQPMRFSTHR